MKQNEYQTQVQIFEWAKLMEGKYPELKLLNASLNGVRMTVGQAKKMKRAGMKKGYPDLFLPIPREGFHGLFIELKVKGGRLSKEQRDWLRALNNQGYYACVCYGFNAATDTIKNYLDGWIKKEEKEA